MTMKAQNKSCLEDLQNIVGKKYLLTESADTASYRKGYRFGEGPVLAVLLPGSLVEQWKILEVCVKYDIIVICQAANTGLTGGSVPDGDNYDRPIVIVNTLRIDGIQVINQGAQVVCLAGSTLYRLEDDLKKWGREPHSVIGSSCIGASVIGGVCNNSGGALVQRGPAYTEMSLFAQIDNSGELKLCNHLGIELGKETLEILNNLDNHNYKEVDVIQTDAKGHDHKYCQHVREIDAPSAARFNADPQLHFEASGSAGKLMVFAVRLDTFPLETNSAVFYLGTNSTQELEEIRHHILGKFQYLPISAEYIHREAFDMAEKYGKDTSWMIKRFGTEVLPKMFRLKGRFDSLVEKIPFLPRTLSDRLQQFSSYFIPSQIPKRIEGFHKKFEHHLILKVTQSGTTETQEFLNSFFKDKRGAYLECTQKEAQAAMLHRFAVATAAIRYRNVHPNEVEDLVSLDIALRRDDQDWFEVLPPELEEKIIHKAYYGHFLCHVMHQDYVIKKGYDCEAIEVQMLNLLDKRGAEYPAEHNVGHLYHAKPALKQFYRKLDPTNSFNPGIGKTSKLKHWEEK